MDKLQTGYKTTNVCLKNDSFHFFKSSTFANLCPLLVKKGMGYTVVWRFNAYEDAYFINKKLQTVAPSLHSDPLVVDDYHMSVRGRIDYI